LGIDPVYRYTFRIPVRMQERDLMAYQFDFGHGSHPGRVRDHNEDAYSYDLGRMVWVVADGMGGKNRGELASRIAALVVKNQAAQGLGLDTAIEKGHAAIQLAAERQNGVDMATTIVVLRLAADLGFELAWVGDSRAYRWSEGQLEMLSHDHSFVQGLLDSGLIDKTEAAEHPYRNVVTRSLGSKPDKSLEVDCIDGRLAAGQRILLCTDGLTGELDDSEIQRCLDQGKGAQATIDELLQRALEHGGGDNIAALLIDILAV